MILTVTISTLPDTIPAGSKVSLSNNGSDVRIMDFKRLACVATVSSPEIRFHTDDAKTEIELSGWVVQDDGRHARHVSFNLE